MAYRKIRKAIRNSLQWHERLSSRQIGSAKMGLTELSKNLLLQDSIKPARLLDNYGKASQVFLHSLPRAELLP